MSESGARLLCSLILSPDSASGAGWKNVEIRSRAALSPDSVSAISVAPISQTIRPKPAYCVQKPASHCTRECSRVHSDALQFMRIQCNAVHQRVVAVQGSQFLAQHNCPEWHSMDWSSVKSTESNAVAEGRSFFTSICSVSIVELPSGGWTLFYDQDIARSPHLLVIITITNTIINLFLVMIIGRTVRLHAL